MLTRLGTMVVIHRNVHFKKNQLHLLKVHFEREKQKISDILSMEFNEVQELKLTTSVPKRTNVCIFNLISCL